MAKTKTPKTMKITAKKTMENEEPINVHCEPLKVGEIKGVVVDQEIINLLAREYIEEVEPTE